MRSLLVLITALSSVFFTCQCADTEMLKTVKTILSDINTTLHRDIVQLRGQLALTNANLSSLRRSLLAEWTNLGAQRARVFPAPAVWQSANETCHAFPARLIQIKGSRANEQIQELLSARSESMFWIGETLSLDFSNDIKYHKLSKSVQCVAIDRRGTWMGRGCTDKLPFICAIDN